MRFLYIAILGIILSSCVPQAEDQYRTKIVADSNKAGANKPLIILHDGPGLNYNYLINHLTPLKKQRDLVFYDQLTCYHRTCSNAPVEMRDLVKQLENVTEKYGNNYGIMVHGWGSVLLMEYLISTPKHKHPNEVIFITPTPLNWLTTANNLRANAIKYSKEEQEELNQVQNPNQCLNALNIAVKHALYDKANIDKLNFDKYDCMIAEHLMGKLSNYNYEAFTYLIPKKSLWITGEQDFYTIPDDKHPVVIKKSAHYPFAENNEEFIRVVQEFFK